MTYYLREEQVSPSIPVMAREQHSFSEQLREAIDQDERSRYRISMETGIPQGQLSRFMHNKGGLSLRNALQQPAVLPRTGSQTDFPQMKQPPVVQGVAGGCTSVQNPLAGVDGNRTHLATFQTPHWV